MRRVCGFLMAALLAVPVWAQDSVSTGGCLPGDAVSPYDDDSATNGSEQCNNYVVDLQEFGSGWGTRFGIAPLIKSSKSGSTFFSSLLSAQSISRLHLEDQPFPASSYDLWTSRGFGVNNDPFINDPGTPVVPPAVGNQFAVAFAEFATTDNAVNYNGVIGAFVNYDPADPNRLYVDRRVVALNGCDDATDVSQFGMGAVDASGNVVFRADGFGGGALGCGLTSLDFVGDDTSDDNIFMVDMASRDCAAQNVISRDYPAGLFDPGTTEWLIRDSETAAVVPNLIPEEVNGATPVYVGTNFDAQFVRGSTFGAITANQDHMAGTGFTDSRGAPSYHSGNCSVLSSSAGVMGQLLNGADGFSDDLLIWGVDSTGNVTGNLVLSLPTIITDPVDGTCFGGNNANEPCRVGMAGDCPGVGGTCVAFNNIPGDNEFDNYHGTAGFRGGTGQVGIGYDQQGRMIVAAMVEHPIDCGADCPFNYIAVARVDCSDGGIEWTMAGWTNLQGNGKPLKDGPGGNIVGKLITLEQVTGGTPAGPSISSPMVDSVGNVYYTSSLERYFSFTPSCTVDMDCTMAGCTGGETCSVDGFCDGCTIDGTDPDSGLVRAVYDPDDFSYELDLLFDAGRPFTGANSGLEYRITFIGVASSAGNINSGTTWSQNITEGAFAGQDPSGLDPASSDTLGGLVMRAEITYDSDDPPNGNISDCTGDIEPDLADQAYQMLMYVSGVVTEVVPCATIADCGDQDNDGFRDDPCLHYACVDGACVESVRGVGQSDMGGSFGACGNDGTCDGNDRFLALNCFGGTWAGDPCEASPPAAINVDAGGSFGSCVLDGVCDGNDAFAALNCFAGDMACPCGGSPAPETPDSVEVVDATRVSLRASANVVRPGDLISVDVYFDDAVSDLRGYQLHLASSGGKRGQLELVDIAVENRKDVALFADWQAFNKTRGQMVAGMDGGGIATDGPAYLATFTYRVSRDAVGSFSIDLLHDDTDPAQRTFLFPTPSRAKIAVSGTTAARIMVASERRAAR